MKPRVFLPAVASGVLLWAAFFPFDLGPLGFVALVPWLTLVRAPVSNRRRYFAAYVGGVAFFALATQWVRVAHVMMYMSWLGLAVVMPLFWLAALAILRRLDRLAVPLAVAVPVAWVALEYGRMHFPTGFPFLKPLGLYQMIGFGWYDLGYTQHAFLPVIQIADLGGVYAVSFVVAAVNGALADLVTRSAAARRALRWADGPPPPAPEEPTPTPSLKAGEQDLQMRKAFGESEEALRAFTPSLQGGGWGVGSSSRGPASAGLAFAGLLLAASIGYGYFRLDHAAFADGPLVSAIQGNIGQGDKMGDPAGLRSSYYKLHVQAFEQKPRPDLIVWPETCQPVDWCEVAPGAANKVLPATFSGRWKLSQEELLGIGWGVPVLFGLNGLEWDGEQAWKYNSALLLKPLPRHPLAKPDDHEILRSEAVARYDKMHLVPFGEYVPLGEQLPFMKAFTPYEKGYECRPGERWTRFPLVARTGAAYTFGCLICYEDSDPYLARQYVASEPVNFFVNISNDGWFNGTEEHEQHLAICRFRAVEARRAVVRSVNMGISAVIDADGRVVALPDPDWSKSKKIDAVVTAVVPIDGRGSLYATLGDWVPAACWATSLLALVLAPLVARTARAGSAEPLPSGTPN
ncbi:apolipoprotein N-acyltransferase [Frigoriglobus tundricola]|uniref:apolipoprotein N-acyltransferase n=1 Tax=Frigoriglobus tundricola TaxID=2774151 RepID=UPI00148EE706|nr:apolipoprotein N-acyltransferase [Frigoriglobus tundricola]